MDGFSELAELALGDGAHELVEKFQAPRLDKKTKAEKDQRARAVTSGLSAVGAGAGAYGLGVAGAEIHRYARKSGLGGFKALKAGIKATPTHTKALIPVEIAGLGGEVMATKILHQDVKRRKERLSKMEPTQSDVHMPTIPTPKKIKQKMILKPMNTLSNKINMNMGKSITWEGEISKVDLDKRQVFGWASIVELHGEPVVDLQGDYIDIDEIEKSAYDYVIKSRKGGDMHRRNGAEPFHASDMIESFLVTPEKKEKLGLPDEVPTGWWVGYQINDPEAWDLVKSGKRTGFSIHGRGRREDMP